MLAINDKVICTITTPKCRIGWVGVVVEVSAKHALVLFDQDVTTSVKVSFSYLKLVTDKLIACCKEFELASLEAEQQIRQRQVRDERGKALFQSEMPDKKEFWDIYLSEVERESWKLKSEGKKCGGNRHLPDVVVQTCYACGSTQERVTSKCHWFGAPQE